MTPASLAPTIGQQTVDFVCDDGTSFYSLIEEVTLLPSFGLKISGTAFWVVHRGRDYGPFDYQWSSDFEGMELHFQSQKFGEYCSNNEIYADLKEFSLPLRVAEVSCLVLGCVIRSVLHALDDDDRIDLILETLTIHGYSKFADVEPFGSEPSQPR